MKQHTVGTIHQLAFMPRIFPINCYLVEEEEDLTLVDAGMAFCERPILRAAQKLGKPIRRIVLTHGHQDHVGSLDGLKKSLPEATVYISERDALILRGSSTLLPEESSNPIRGSIPKGISTVPDVLLTDGDRIGSLLAVSSPGHTPGSMAFLDTRNNALLAGDAFQTKGGIAVSGVVRPFFPFPAMATWHKKSAIASAKRLLALQPSLLAVGHGPMLSKPCAAMKIAIETAEQQ